MKSRIKTIGEYGRRHPVRMLSAVIIIIAAAVFGLMSVNNLERAHNDNGKRTLVGEAQERLSQEDVAKEVEAKLKTIMETGPQSSSNPYNYIKNNKAFNELVAVGDPALKYMFASFEQSNADGLREYIMACACAKIMGIYDTTNGIGISSGREWFYKYSQLEKDSKLQIVDADFDIFSPSDKGSDVLLPDTTNEYDMDDVIGKYILARNRGSYGVGEKAIEAHKIYRTEANGDILNVYMQMTFGWFGFENGVFTPVSGCGVIPLKMQLSKSSEGEYKVVDYREAMDGSMYIKSVREMFPKDLADRFIKDDEKTGTELWNAQVNQAKEYLKIIGRDGAPVLAYAEKNSLDEKANQAIYYVTQTKQGFPDWNGSKEVLIRTGGPPPGANVRCILETRCTSEGIGKYTITLTRTWQITINGKPVISYWKYSVAGKQVELLESQDQDDRIRTIN